MSKTKKLAPNVNAEFTQLFSDSSPIGNQTYDNIMNNNSTHNPTYALNSNRSSGDSSYRDNANVNFKIINTDGEDMESDAINNQGYDQRQIATDEQNKLQHYLQVLAKNMKQKGDQKDKEAQADAKKNIYRQSLRVKVTDSYTKVQNISKMNQQTHQQPEKQVPQVSNLSSSLRNMQKLQQKLQKLLNSKKSSGSQKHSIKQIKINVPIQPNQSQRSQSEQIQSLQQIQEILSIKSEAIYDKSVHLNSYSQHTQPNRQYSANNLQIANNRQPINPSPSNSNSNSVNQSNNSPISTSHQDNKSNVSNNERIQKIGVVDSSAMERIKSRISKMNEQQEQHVYTFMPVTTDMPVTISRYREKQAEKQITIREPASICKGQRKQINKLDLISKIRQSPQLFINHTTSRNSLFNIIYVLQAYNKQLTSKLQITRNYNTQQKCDTIKGLSQAQKQTIFQHIKQQNAQLKAQQKLVEVYRRQKTQLIQRIEQKKNKIKQLQKEGQTKQKKSQQLQSAIKEVNNKIEECNKEKTKLMNQLKKKKVLEKSTDNGIIDKLFNQYYDTIKEVLAEDSVERINANTQNALDEVEKKKGVGFMNYIMEQISKDGKNNTGVKRSQNLLNNTQNMDKLNSSKNQ